MRTCITLLFAVLALQSSDRSRLLNPADSFFAEPAEPITRIRFDTTAGVFMMEVHRAWAPRGADRFVNLVRARFYNGATIFRIRPGTWAQFGIPADPAVAKAWRSQTFPDDPFRETNTRGTVAFAFAVPDGRTTQVFINLRDNAATHDKEPFVPFGRVTEGLDVADRFFAEYGEGLGGIRAGKQDPAFAEGNAFFDRVYPKLDRIRTASIVFQEP
jgi:cyclophilin family peptidyl-prolyl cis-trans isomerase